MKAVNIQLSRGSSGGSGAGLGVESDMGVLTINESFSNFGSNGLYDVPPLLTTRCTNSPVPAQIAEDSQKIFLLLLVKVDQTL